MLLSSGTILREAPGYRCTMGIVRVVPFGEGQSRYSCGVREPGAPRMVAFLVLVIFILSRFRDGSVLL